MYNNLTILHNFEKFDLYHRNQRFRFNQKTFLNKRNLQKRLRSSRTGNKKWISKKKIENAEHTVYYRRKKHRRKNTPASYNHSLWAVAIVDERHLSKMWNFIMHYFYYGIYGIWNLIIAQLLGLMSGKMYLIYCFVKYWKKKWWTAVKSCLFAKRLSNLFSEIFMKISSFRIIYNLKWSNFKTNRTYKKHDFLPLWPFASENYDMTLKCLNHVLTVKL